MTRLTRKFAAPLTALAALAMVAAIPACQTDSPGVKTSVLNRQYAQVDAGTKDATETAKEVLESLDLQNVQSAATGIDGQVIGYTADGTKVTVSIERVTDSTSTVTTKVGTLGDSDLGLQIVNEIRERLADDAG